MPHSKMTILFQLRLERTQWKGRNAWATFWANPCGRPQKHMLSGHTHLSNDLYNFFFVAYTDMTQLLDLLIPCCWD